jgi:uncharacterized membrane protein
LGGVLSYANCVNDFGVVVGNVQYADGHTQGFMWTSQAGTVRIDPWARRSIATWITNAGVIAGAALDQDPAMNAVLWDMNLERHIIAWAPHGAVASCVNERNQAVGYRIDGYSFALESAFAWPSGDDDSEWTDLFEEDSTSFATGINARGDIVGYVDRRAFLRRKNGSVRMLAGGSSRTAPAYATAISDKGNVLVSQIGKAYLFTPAQMVRINGVGSIYPFALNYADTVVGTSISDMSRAFVWDPKNGFAFIDDQLNTRGWQILSANSVNRAGMIAGYGIHNGRRRAVVLIPIQS